MSGLFLDPFLNSGVMFASFHSEGTIPSSSDKLKNLQVVYQFAQQFPETVLVVSHQIPVIYYLSSS